MLNSTPMVAFGRRQPWCIDPPLQRTNQKLLSLSCFSHCFEKLRYFHLHACILLLFLTILCFGRSPSTKDTLSNFCYILKSKFRFSKLGYENGEVGRKVLSFGPVLEFQA